jgi:hypothetical protein
MALASATSGKEGDLVLRDLKGKRFQKIAISLCNQNRTFLQINLEINRDESYKVHNVRLRLIK